MKAARFPGSWVRAVFHPYFVSSPVFQVLVSLGL